MMGPDNIPDHSDAPASSEEAAERGKRIAAELAP
jgi:hypothetical protein